MDEINNRLDIVEERNQGTCRYSNRKYSKWKSKEKN